MARRRLLAALPLALAACAGPGGPEPGEAGPSPRAEPPAGPVEAPRWRVGSEWRYNDGYGLRVIETDGEATRFERLDDPRQWVRRRGFLREDSQSSTALRRLLFEDLPPGAGQRLLPGTPLAYRREYEANGAPRAHATSWTVERRERVRVPAGEFDCSVLVMRTRSLLDDWTGYERWWFSPEAQNYVRMEYRYGPDPAGARVLVSYVLAPG